MCLQITELTEAEAKQKLPKFDKSQNHKFYKVLNGKDEFFYFSACKNHYHGRNTYIQFHFLKQQNDAKTVFSFLKNYFASPLQCMLQSSDKRVPILLSSGFKLTRRCFKREFTKADLKSNNTVNNVAVFNSEDENYTTACRLLYKAYAKTHEIINPLTAGFEEFTSDLPQTLYCSHDGVDKGFAFTEENEICYVGGSGNLENFFAGVLNKIFSKYQSVLFEADDVDTTAMQLKNMFKDTCQDSFDTYIFTGEEYD